MTTEVKRLLAEVSRLRSDLSAGLGPEEAVMVEQTVATLREENARLRTRAYRATHTTPGTHSTACITWGDDGQGNLSDGGRVPAGACSCGAWPAWLTRERDEARLKLVAESQRADDNYLRACRAESQRDEARAEVAHLKANNRYQAGYAAGERDAREMRDAWHIRAEAHRQTKELAEAEVGRLRAITSPGDAAAFEEHMATREAHWVAQVKRLEKRNLHNVTAYSQELTQRTTELQRAEAEVARLNGIWEKAEDRCPQCGTPNERLRWARAKLAAWQTAESLPDCPACAALEAERGE